jgi:hypothetical protein
MVLLSNKKVLLYTGFLIKLYFKQYKYKLNKIKKGISPDRETPPCYDKSFLPYYIMGCPQKIGGSYHGSKRKTINGY